ncbi:MFS transporter [Corynebacterium uterequi]|uniref:Glycoside/pentoside/hexuronide transporter n=1 Tax=Corynebacterium uterequi TaxID=1072256 RepID=A0A0G3HBL0_9CORY|nr:glycoside-pentoside-hexuronide (GPH):cation symporter [Corynebacterium uterequi]AKK10085.1 glycoside/pentoside/hexuronide transporter [Corynebacterium uterequi]
MTAPSPELSSRDRKYLRWYNIVGYGTGDIAGNVVYALLAAFLMIFLTDEMGMNPGIVGTLMLLSKIFDGASDIVFGALMDRTRSRWGKARPWMLFAFFGCGLTLIGIFAIPPSLGATAQYAWFFICYTLLNAVFYTANNIAYSALTALVTRNADERVQMGSARFIFAFATNMTIQYVTLKFVAALGGGPEAWRNAAIVYVIIGIITNTLAVFSVRELPEEELPDDDGATATDPVPLGEGIALLVRNKYYLLILFLYLTNHFYNAFIGTGVYFMTYIMGDADLLAQFGVMLNFPPIVALFLTPILVTKLGMYRLNLGAFAIAVLGRGIVIYGGLQADLTLMLVGTIIGSFGSSPINGTLNALIAEASDHTYLKSGKRIEGLMYSCTSLGVKLGGGLGTAMTGWLLQWSGYDGTAQTQKDAALAMISTMYLWIPFVLMCIITILVFFLDVERVNEKLRHQRLM